ncbi:MAG: hypothetical protein A2W61_06090 [Deltaproteobacteria bacterium RIFCSPLOWO2_01_44_7]|nr:MAG: hypothetical protein A2712_01980 [Deltaproteobacteria bacterium RIFCSPHIGHO2_01_FULL_43_49]OGQ15105.1 MAG: hypothetical protein A3D22_03500 [Deltaproteobacteria bacterium RIFCSPHIGHO2_02_FULL_44_53]OGQ27275.1 MAG: hypothetical protein A3D98_02575 [Deltaproteobacteria bacterium RIFCSPHIGHO2_12_FULL_44_21]OGQ31622.1 MAG: hypothetical protein A2979_04660 [Deltaproteobacteria bacterium RIFCSPLOWO2_01_FULL_45_74]OGQ38284.1 MAG: hypothetical protein A2W61_06090 [Deltaproteobacteria bacterium 
MISIANVAISRAAFQLADPAFLDLSLSQVERVLAPVTPFSGVYEGRADLLEALEKGRSEEVALSRAALLKKLVGDTPGVSKLFADPQDLFRNVREVLGLQKDFKSALLPDPELITKEQKLTDHNNRKEVYIVKDLADLGILGLSTWKYVVVELADGTQEIRIGSYKGLHVEMMLDDEKIVGAGYIENKEGIIELDGSSTFLSTYPDRVENSHRPIAEESGLKAVRKAFRKILGKDFNLMVRGLPNEPESLSIESSEILFQRTNGAKKRYLLIVTIDGEPKFRLVDEGNEDGIETMDPGDAAVDIGEVYQSRTADGKPVYVLTGTQSGLTDSLLFLKKLLGNAAIVASLGEWMLHPQNPALQ